ncbi:MULTISPECIES: hypothetical protein [Nostoc]|nr:MULTISPECIES: hypothetical protein [Nostoc]MBD2682862.1 hypothetical protein [Nostoc sp. FACHB-857]
MAYPPTESDRSSTSFNFSSLRDATRERLSFLGAIAQRFQELPVADIGL